MDSDCQCSAYCTLHNLLYTYGVSLCYDFLGFFFISNCHCKGVTQIYLSNPPFHFSALCTFALLHFCTFALSALCALLPV